jgi:hypothetical protein
MFESIFMSKQINIRNSNFVLDRVSLILIDIYSDKKEGEDQIELSFILYYMMINICSVIIYFLD